MIECLERKMKLNWFLMKLYNIKVYFNKLKKKRFKWESSRPRPFFSPGGTGRPAHLRFLYSQVCLGLGQLQHPLAFFSCIWVLHKWRQRKKEDKERKSPSKLLRNLNVLAAADPWWTGGPGPTCWKFPRIYKRPGSTLGPQFYIGVRGWQRNNFFLSPL